MKRIRILSGAAGGALLVIALILQSLLPGREKVVQITVWTLAVLTTAILGNYEHFREKWFWKGLLLGSLVHILVVYSYRSSLPFSSLGIAGLMGFLEALVWQVIFRRLSATPSGMM
ncbi:MAG: hypothetical protein LAO21_04010 [Acidobacteriia bacterium]|nr:hypothetical protein [Terriglobia bacterium]